MLEALKVIIFGIVEGITEWLPVSSTGHMILVDQFMKLKVSEEFWQMFLVVISMDIFALVIYITQFVIRTGINRNFFAS